MSTGGRSGSGAAGAGGGGCRVLWGIQRAVDASTRVLAADNLPGRLRALRQITLAGALLCAREREAGLAAAHQAVDRVAAIRSVRAANRLRYLTEAAKAWPRHRDAIDLRRRIAALWAA